MDCQQHQGSMQGGGNHMASEAPGPIPAGLDALYSACRRLYPEQSNPLQVTALVKYWLGGPDPLDYISMYANPGDPDMSIPPHWHYVSFGCSDLHGDGRVHEQSGPETPSGFGFELTMRVKREEDEKNPPTWPAAIMQGLAKYVFSSETVLCVGDHVSWHCPLDNSESRIQHMLMGSDPQLGRVSTANGSVEFIQIIGVTAEELKAGQHWNGCGVIDIMKRLSGAGGPWMVTDMRRGESIYEIEPAVAEEIEAGIESEGSNLSGVSARIAWSQQEISSSELSSNEGVNTSDSGRSITDVESEQIKFTLKKGLIGSGIALEDANKENGVSGDLLAGRGNPGESAELFVTQPLENLHLSINLESGALLPLALRGRLKHGRHFTFKSVLGIGAVTFVPPSVDGAFVDISCPYATQGPWLQVLIPDDFISQIIEDTAHLANPDEVSVPAIFRWPDRNLSITILGEEL